MKEFIYKQRPQTKEYTNNYDLIDWDKPKPNVQSDVMFCPCGNPVGKTGHLIVGRIYCKQCFKMMMY